MPQIVADLRRIAPQIRIRLIAENTLSDLQRREAYILVWHVAPTQPELISRTVREDIRDVAYICIGEEDEMIPFLQNWGLPIKTQNFKVLGDSGTVGWEMTRQGLGLMPMTEDLVPMFPEMKLMLSQFDPVPIPCCLTNRRELHSSRRIRLVCDRIAEILSQRDLPLPQR